MSYEFNEDSNAYVYCILNIYTDKKYVGVTKNMGRRKTQHLSLMRKGKHFSSLLQKEYDEFGGDKSVRFIVLEELEFPNKEMLLQKEQFWIDLYKPEYNGSLLAGNNIPASGKTPDAIRKANEKRIGRKQSKEEKDKRAGAIKKFWKTHPAKTIPQEMREHLSKINTGESNPNWGLKRSDETRKAISDGNAKHIRAGFVSPDGVEYRNVRNMGWFCREHSLNYFCMRDLDHGRLKSYKGWTKIQKPLD